MGNYHPPDEELLFGVGVAVGGPTVYSAPFLDLYFIDEIAFELGAFAVTDVVWGHFGFRVVPIERRTMRLFVGAFAHGATYSDSDDHRATATSPTDDEAKRRLSAVGPRLGVDWVLDSGHYAIRTEFDVVYSLRSTWLFGIESRLIPWGGLSMIAYQ